MEPMNTDDKFTKLDDGSIIVSLHPVPRYSDPYLINEIVHVIADSTKPNIKGKLVISVAPGKKELRYKRNMDQDLGIIKDRGINVIVCLLKWCEMEKLGLTEYPMRAQSEGFIFYHLPIQDRGTAFQSDLEVIIPTIVNHIIAGKNVLVHCRCGLGRAGTICACCLGHFGYDGKTAIDAVRKRRPGAIHTSRQERCVIDYCKKLSM